MRIRNLGATGLKVTEVCLGTMTFGNQADEATSFQILDAAEARGVNFIDTADAYPLGRNWESAGATEEIIGNWMRERKSRDRIVLADNQALELDQAEADALAASIHAHFGDSFRPLVLQPRRWYLHLPQAPQLSTTPLSCA